MRISARALLLPPENAAPGLFPIVAEKIDDAPVGLEELVRRLEHGEHQPALRARPGLVAAARRAPDEVARLAFALAADEAAFEHVGLLDQHVLVIRQPRTRRHPDEHGHQPGLALDEQQFGLDARMRGLGPWKLRHFDEARCHRRQPAMAYRLRSMRTHAFKCSPTLTIFIVFVPPALPIGSPMVRTIRSPSLTAPLSTSTFSASCSSSSRSWPTYLTMSGNTSRNSAQRYRGPASRARRWFGTP